MRLLIVAACFSFRSRMDQPASGLHRTGRAARFSILYCRVLSCRIACWPPGKLRKEVTCLVASQAYNTAVFVYNRRPVSPVRAAGPCRWLAPRPGLPRPGPITACIHAHFYLGHTHSLLPRLSGLVLTMYDRIPLT